MVFAAETDLIEQQDQYDQYGIETLGLINEEDASEANTVSVSLLYCGATPSASVMSFVYHFDSSSSAVH